MGTTTNLPWQLEHLDQHGLERMITIAIRTRDALLSGMVAVRRLDQALPESERHITRSMTAKLGSLVLAWDEVAYQADQLLTRQQTREQQHALRLPLWDDEPPSSRSLH
jgi:predicted lipoprotein